MIHNITLVEWECDDCNKISSPVREGKSPRGWKEFIQIDGRITYKHEICPDCSKRRDGPLKKREVWKIKTGNHSRRQRRVK